MYFTFKNTVIIFVSSVLLFSCNKNEVQKTAVSENIYYDFSDMNKFFTEYVKDGKVDYAKVKENKSLDKIINEIKSIEPYLIEDGNERMAYWINVYNIYTIKLITDYYPIKSILDIEQKTGMNPWKINFIEMAGGRKFSLDEIEKEIIIPKYKDPRIHYSLVCAAESCPEIISEAYLPDKLNEQFERQAKIFLNDRKKNFLYRQDNEVFLSMIYKWYKKDFIRKDSTVINHIEKYINENDKDFMIKNNTNKILHLDYSWKLNDTDK